MRLNGALIGRGLHPQLPCHPADFPRELLLVLPGADVLDYAVGEGNIIAPVGHFERATIAEQNPDVMTGKLCIVPAHFVDVEDVNPFHRLQKASPGSGITADVNQDFRISRMHEAKEQLETPHPP
jgi:hypothetical protein